MSHGTLSTRLIKLPAMPAPVKNKVIQIVNVVTTMLSRCLTLAVGDREQCDLLSSGCHYELPRYMNLL